MEIICPVCRNNYSKYKFTINSVPILKCLKCKAYISNITDIKDKRLYESNDYFIGKRRIISNNDKNNYLSFLPAINLLKKYLSEHNDINFLELGPGNGKFSLAAQSQGWEVFCLDVSQIVIDNLKSINIKGDKFNGKEFKTDNKYSIIVMKHVLEHIDQPRTIMNSICKALKNNGILYIQVPNTFSLDRFYHRKKWSGWDIPYHLIHYNYYCLKYLMNSFGINIEYYDHTFFSIIGHLKNGLLKNDLFGDHRNITSIAKNNLQDRSINAKTISKAKKLLKTLFSERDITIIGRKI